MDPNGNIYSGAEDEIPAEDKARLEGYFRGRFEALKHEAELLRAMKAGDLVEDALKRDEP